MAKASNQPEPITVAGPVGALEALFQLPAKQPRAIGVACHPHPLHQGTMRNKVAHTLARAMVDAGAATLRFNFRGVGKSEGEFDNAVGETADALAAVAWLRERYPDLPLWLGGFSFGAQVSIQAAARARPDKLISIAPPVARFGDSRPSRPDCPWLLVQGEADEIVDPEAVFAWADAYQSPPQVESFPEVGHFFHGHLTPLHRTLLDFLE
ncbi:alpha/beta fold hydrolase [Gammaproteobacteria bacterium AB-CW1]|uniref:Alpha/beta fold hydrolase n=1 Tax=Natronospira elongata TaxID=3110268 RepID=A0AAP6JF81_9GAMM|nr:alpha/beta fold hydrolase [Gammaproteobacteria bacterium AB-CW1]